MRRRIAISGWIAAQVLAWGGFAEFQIVHGGDHAVPVDPDPHRERTHSLHLPSRGGLPRNLRAVDIVTKVRVVTAGAVDQ